MGWLNTGRQIGKAEAGPGEILAGPVPERLGWPVAAVLILGTSAALWFGLGASVAWIMGWR